MTLRELVAMVGDEGLDKELIAPQGMESRTWTKHPTFSGLDLLSESPDTIVLG